MNEHTPDASSSSWAPPSPEHMKSMLPQYDQWSVLGVGGMGAVYKARQTSLDRVVAIKVLPPEAAQDADEFGERFTNEARTMARMNHPAIVSVYDFGKTADGLLHFVMEYIDGTDVAKMLQLQGRLPADHALAITSHVCDALAYAHEHHVVHLDIKPANILINMEGAVKVADFGLASVQEPGKARDSNGDEPVMGTPDFVAPETLTPGMTVDGRADLYAVGVMLYNMLTGEIPRGSFKPPSEVAGCDSRFDEIVRKAMQFDVGQRYQSAREIRRDLDRIQTVPAAKERPAQRPAGMAPRPRQHVPAAPPPKSAPWGMIAAIFGVCAVAGYFVLKRDPEPQTAETAETAAKAPAKVAPVVEPPKKDEPKKAEPVPMPVVVLEDPGAPKGSSLSVFPVLKHAGHYYQVVETPMKQVDAQQHAESLGAHLLTITSESEMAWLDEVLPPLLKQVSESMATIGGKREDEQPWSWLTGEAFSYSRWEDAKTPGSDPRRKFVLKLTANSSGTLAWGIGYFDVKRAFIIEWDGTSKPAPEPMKPAPPVVAAESEAAKRLLGLETSFRAALERDVLGKHRAALADLNGKYLAALDRAMSAASSPPEGLALREEKQRVEAGEPLPTDDPPELVPSLKALRSTYRTSLKPIELERHNGSISLFVKYEEVLKALQAELTQAGNLEDARLVGVRQVEIARERKGGVEELLPEGKELVLKVRERFTSAESYAPPVEFTIVAKTDGQNLRLAYTAKQVIFNWEVNPDELRLDADPGGARSLKGRGVIPADTFVTITWRVFPHMQSISVDGERRVMHFGDYSKVSKPVEVFPMNSVVTVKSVQVRALELKSLEERISSVPEMRGPLQDDKDWTGPLTIPAGRYQPLRRINIGTNLQKTGRNADETRGDVTSLPGMRMENVRFHMLEGSWKADGGHFHDVRITADLGGSFQAKNSLFQDCAFAKEGPWYTTFFSSKWSFTNCVLTGSFMQNWKLGDVGMKAEGCTFHDIDLIPITYRVDAGAEVKKDWVHIKDCHFIKCRVPESFALATQNCLFEKCTFSAPEEKLIITSALNAVVFLKDPVNQPQAGASRSFEVKDAAQLASPVGAKVPHTLKAGRLEFSQQ